VNTEIWTGNISTVTTNFPLEVDILSVGDFAFLSGGEYVAIMYEDKYHQVFIKPYLLDFGNEKDPAHTPPQLSGYSITILCSDITTSWIAPLPGEGLICFGSREINIYCQSAKNTLYRDELFGNKITSVVKIDSNAYLISDNKGNL